MIYVIAWNREQRGPVAIRAAADMRRARKVAETLWEQYPWLARVSYLREVDASISADVKDEPFLPDGGWSEWR